MNIKSYTSVEQSRKLAKILPLESADMFYNEEPEDETYPKDIVDIEYPMILREGHIRFLEEYGIPCWSLASLLEQIPYEVCDDDGNSFYLQIYKKKGCYQLAYIDPYEDFEAMETGTYDDFVDACYEMILKLKKLNLL